MLLTHVDMLVPIAESVIRSKAAWTCYHTLYISSLSDTRCSTDWSIWWTWKVHWNRFV